MSNRSPIRLKKAPEQTSCEPDFYIEIQDLDERIGNHAGNRTVGEINAVPFWDAKTRMLFWSGRLVKQFRTPAPNQELILNAFQTSGWASRIENPLSNANDEESQNQLREAVRRLNGKHKFKALCFHRDGTGRGITWEAL